MCRILCGISIIPKDFVLINWLKLAHTLHPDESVLVYPLDNILLSLFRLIFGNYAFRTLSGKIEYVGSWFWGRPIKIYIISMITRFDFCSRW